MAGKAGRPSKAKETKNEIACQEYYLNWKSAIYTAKQLGLNPHTVEKYFQKFRQKEIEESEEQFMQRQRMAKNQVLSKLDEMINHLEKQVKRYSELMDNEELDTTPDGQRVEAQYTKAVSELSQMYQQKADIELTATMDVRIDKVVQEKYEEYIQSKAR